MYKYRVMKRKGQEWYGIQWWAWFWPFWCWQTTVMEGGAWTYMTFSQKEEAESWVTRQTAEEKRDDMRRKNWEQA